MKYLTSIIGIVVFLMGTVISHAGDISVIVHPSNPLTTISQAQLKIIFLYEREFWNDGSRVFLVVRESGSAEKINFLDQVYDISEGDFKRALLSKLFKGEIPSLPRVMRSNKAMRVYVANFPGSIGFVDSNFSDSTVRTLKIDGKLPGHPLYFLRSRK